MGGMVDQSGTDPGFYVSGCKPIIGVCVTGAVVNTFRKKRVENFLSFETME